MRVKSPRASRAKAKPTEKQAPYGRLRSPGQRSRRVKSLASWKLDGRKLQGGGTTDSVPMPLRRKKRRRRGRCPASGLCPHVRPPQLTSRVSSHPLSWLSFLNHGQPYEGEVDGSISRSRVRWPMAYPAGTRILLQVAEVEQRERALKLGMLRG